MKLINRTKKLRKKMGKKRNQRRQVRKVVGKGIKSKESYIEMGREKEVGFIPKGILGNFTSPTKFVRFHI